MTNPFIPYSDAYLGWQYWGAAKAIREAASGEERFHLVMFDCYGTAIEKFIRAIGTELVATFSFYCHDRNLCGMAHVLNITGMDAHRDVLSVYTEYFRVQREHSVTPMEIAEAIQSLSDRDLLDATELILEFLVSHITHNRPSLLLAGKAKGVQTMELR